MPTYDYRCEACKHEMAAFQGIKEEALKVCPKCGEPKLKRLIGSGAGIIFKGSGFYETDYKRSRTSSGGGESKSSDKSSESKPAETKPADPKKSKE
jgi:putative FmdB family regulatory protein